ncbi:hypothetical protein LCGC14_1795530 [marine sediment metagenome]|uniref:Uncharacterized protein n=1 Tax=marine sediment metagenome TaxID=412755 RepID=A0A0F9JQU0_9ZZZZ
MRTKIWYSVQSGGDGSAYPIFMESEELAKIDQEFSLHTDSNDWAESCEGCITLESDTDIKVCDGIETVESLIAEVDDNYDADDDTRPTKRYNALLALREKAKK